MPGRPTALAYGRAGVLRIQIRLPILLCAVKTVEGDFRFCWIISPNVGQSKKISNDQELIQSDPISCPQNQKGNN